MGNLLGIDYGKSKIGIALAPKSLLALKLKVLTNDDNFFKELARIIQENEVDKIVVGLPLNMDGTKSKETKEAEEFAEKLQEKFTKLRVVTYDERLSTVEAKKNLPGKLPDDTEAARIILQGYLDKRKKQL